MIRASIVWIILGTAIVTLIPRVAPLLFLSRIELPERVVTWLGYVPIAVLSALLAQAVAMPDGHLALPPENLALCAILPVLIIASLTKSLIGTVVSGVLFMALLRLLMG